MLPESAPATSAPEPAPRPELAIETRGLGRDFDGRPAVEGLDLEVHRGETFALLGPNGAGKTTTVRMLACLLTPSAGRARVLGRGLRRQAQEIRARVGLLTESPGLYDRLTASQVLRFYADLYSVDDAAARVAEYLEILDLYEHRDRPTGGFSKGMKQKLALARALIHEPDLLFLDEPTSGLDVATARWVRGLLRRLRAEGRTILLTTHNLDEAERVADRVGVLNRRMLAADTPENLRARFFTTRIRVDVTGAGSAAEVAAALAGIDELTVIETTEQAVSFEVDDADALVPEAVRRLVEAGLGVRAVVEERAHLEEVYLQIVREESGP